MGISDNIVCPVKFSYARKYIGPHPRILDIGCGNHSSKLTKKWFPGSYYAGADIQVYNNSDDDYSLMEAFYPLRSDGSGYDKIPDDSFDFVVMNHVVEHMHDPATIVAAVCRKLKKGGVIWIAFPSIRSLSLPSAVGTLQFCDDDTHIRIVDIREIANVLLDHGVKVIHAGRSRNLARFLAGLAILPWAELSKALTGKMSARGLWYVLGFEDHVLGLRR